MTRINANIPVKELSDRHLMAEHREIKRIPNTIASGKAKIENIPTHFKLGTGHVKFFYDKGLYLYKRYQQIQTELNKRNYNLDATRVFKVIQFPTDYYNDWKPTDRDRAIIRERIEERIKQKPNWYRHNGKPLL